MATINMTAMNAVLKELYDGQVVQNMVYSDNPLLALLKKNSERGGRYTPIPIQTGVSQGRSSTFSNAQANQSANIFKEFLVTLQTDYSLATLDNKTMMAARGDKMSFVSAAKSRVDGAIRILKNSMGSAVFRSGTGTIGTISAISSGVITLTNRSDIVQFYVNQALDASATDGGAPRAAVGYVIALDKSAGKVTVSTSAGGAAASPASWAAGDSLLVDGDSNAKISGLAAWLPWTAPTAGDNFFGVDRSSDVVSLAGNRYDGSTQTIEEAIQDALNEIDLYGDGNTSHLFLNKNTYTALEKSQGSKIQYVDMKSDGNAQIGFRGIMINGPRGPVTVMSDRNCPALFGYALDMSSWTLGSAGEAPAIVTYGDNLEVLRLTNADATELRVAAYYNLECNAPGHNGVIKFSA